MNELQLRRNSINPIEVLKLAFDRKKWGEEYVLYTYGSITVKCSLITFNFEKNYGDFRLHASCDYENKRYETTSSISYYMGRDDIESFQRRLLVKVKEMLHDPFYHYSSCLLYKIAEHETDLEKVKSWNIKLNNKIAKEYGFEEEYAEALEISNDRFRDLALSDIVDKIEEKANKVWLDDIKRIFRDLQKDFQDYAGFMSSLGDC